MNDSTAHHLYHTIEIQNSIINALNLKVKRYEEALEKIANLAAQEEGRRFAIYWVTAKKALNDDPS